MSEAGAPLIVASALLVWEVNMKMKWMAAALLCATLGMAAFAKGRTGETPKAESPGAPGTQAAPAPKPAAPLINVAIYDDSIWGDGSYFDGYNSNSWEEYQELLDGDPLGRFSTQVVTDLSAATLAPFDVLCLPDNAVPDGLEGDGAEPITSLPNYLPDVAAWFAPGKVIVCVDSAVSYAQYSGFFWPGYGGNPGDVGNGTLWDYDSCWDDGSISALNYITDGYYLGQHLSTIDGDAQFYPWMLPPNAVTFLEAETGDCDYFAAGKGALNRNGASSTPRFRPESEVIAPMVYGVYRDIPGHGRMVLLGPYDEPYYFDEYAPTVDGALVEDVSFPMLRNAHTLGPPDLVHLNFTDDNGTSQMCVHRITGDFDWWILSGWYAGGGAHGTLQVMNGGTQFWSNYQDPYYVYCTFDPINYTAWAYFFDYLTYDYGMIWDSYILDNPPCGEDGEPTGDRRQ